MIPALTNSIERIFAGGMICLSQSVHCFTIRTSGITTQPLASLAQVAMNHKHYKISQKDSGK